MTLCSEDVHSPLSLQSQVGLITMQRGRETSTMIYLNINNLAHHKMIHLAQLLNPVHDRLDPLLTKNLTHD